MKCPKYRIKTHRNNYLEGYNYAVEHRVQVKLHWWSFWKTVIIYPQDNLDKAQDYLMKMKE